MPGPVLGTGDIARIKRDPVPALIEFTVWGEQISIRKSQKYKMCRWLSITKRGIREYPRRVSTPGTYPP